MYISEIIFSNLGCGLCPTLVGNSAIGLVPFGEGSTELLYYTNFVPVNNILMLHYSLLGHTTHYHGARIVVTGSDHLGHPNQQGHIIWV